MNWEGTPLTPDDLEKTWRNFRRCKKDPRSESARKLLLHYLPLVKKIAAKVFTIRGKPPTFDFDDLASAGLDGLYFALQRFDPARRVGFETYATRRIRGAILDTLRENDHLPRLRRCRSRQLNAATNAAAQKYGRPPADHEIAHELHIPLRDFAQFRSDAQAPLPVYLHASRPSPKSNKPHTLANILHAPPAPNPAEAADLQKYLLQGINRTSRLLLILYYAEKLSMKEIGAVFNVSESRISQLHSQTIALLQHKLLAPHTDDNLPPSAKPKPKK